MTGKGYLVTEIYSFIMRHKP